MIPKKDLTNEEIKAVMNSWQHWDEDIVARLEAGDKVSTNWRWENGDKIKDTSLYCAFCKLVTFQVI